MAYIGFKKLQQQLQGEWHSKESAWKIAYSIWKKKYWKKGMAERAKRGRRKSKLGKGISSKR